MCVYEREGEYLHMYIPESGRQQEQDRECVRMRKRMEDKDSENAREIARENKKERERERTRRRGMCWWVSDHT